MALLAILGCNNVSFNWILAKIGENLRYSALKLGFYLVNSVYFTGNSIFRSILLILNYDYHQTTTDVVKTNNFPLDLNIGDY